MFNSRTISNITGLILSVGCVIHCMLMPVFIANLPYWGLSWLASPMFHKSLALIGMAIGIYTLLPGWRIHQRISVLLWGGLGLLIMNYAAFFEDSCCANPSEQSTASASVCCTKSCCSTSKGETESASPQPVQASQGNFAMVYWAWLLKHPTVIGATFLAWAHCLNGNCTRKCCKA